MKIIVPPITVPVLLTDYHPALLLPDSDKPMVVHVWVNPPRDNLAEHGRLVEAWSKVGETLKAANPKGGRKGSKGAKGDRDRASAQAAMTAANDGIAGWYARLWSQGADPALHWTADEVKDLATLETDPALYPWLTRTSWELIAAHRAGRKKA